MAKERKAKIASRERARKATEQKHSYSTRPEDVVQTLPDGRVIAQDDEGRYYFTEPRYVGAFFADPNRYGRPSARLTAEQVETLLGEEAPSAESS